MCEQKLDNNEMLCKLKELAAAYGYKAVINADADDSFSVTFTKMTVDEDVSEDNYSDISIVTTQSSTVIIE